MNKTGRIVIGFLLIIWANIIFNKATVLSVILGIVGFGLMLPTASDKK